ncbi:MAG: tetratricopeptide repeat protein, partial [Gemmataceae bacterium]
TSGLLSDAKGTVGSGVKTFTAETYALTQLEVLVFYQKQILWPTKLCLDYIDWPAKTSITQVWPQALLILVSLAGTTIGLYRRSWWGLLGAWYFLILAPTSSVVPVQDAVFEHRLYLPLLSTIVALVAVGYWLMRTIAERFNDQNLLFVPAVVAVCITAIFLGFRTVLRNADYVSPLRIWGDVVAKRPNNYRARAAYSSELLKIGATDEASKQVDQALVMLPNNIAAKRSSGFVKLEQSDAAAAAKEFEGLLNDLPADQQLFYWAGISRFMLGEYPTAQKHLETAIDLNPSDSNTKLALVVLYDLTKQIQKRDNIQRGLQSVAPVLCRSLDTIARKMTLDASVQPQKLIYAQLHAHAAVLLSTRKVPEYLDTLALLSARQQKFEVAIALNDEVLQLVRAAGIDHFVRLYEHRHTLYVRRVPYDAIHAMEVGGR